MTDYIAIGLPVDDEEFLKDAGLDETIIEATKSMAGGKVFHCIKCNREVITPLSGNDFHLSCPRCSGWKPGMGAPELIQKLGEVMPSVPIIEYSTINKISSRIFKGFDEDSKNEEVAFLTGSMKLIFEGTLIGKTELLKDEDLSPESKMTFVLTAKNMIENLGPGESEMTGKIMNFLVQAECI